MFNEVFLEVATSRNKKKLGVINRDSQEELPMNNLSRDTNVPRFIEKYITHVSEDIKRRVTEMSCQEFSRTEGRILGALSKLGGKAR